MEAPEQPSVVQLWTHPILDYQKIKGDKTYVEALLVVEAPGQLPSLPSPKSGPVVSGDIRLFVKNACPTIYKNIYIRCTIIYKNI